ncbi:putative protein LONGIFOLIA [Helianthus annuus]|nr:putative protein LONGIFOLIA [Helianthus annuus]
MSGFLHIFDRQQILTGKRIYSTKRLPSSTGADASPESVKSVKFVHFECDRETEKPVVKAEPDVTVPPKSRPVPAVSGGEFKCFSSDNAAEIATTASDI